MITPDRIKAFLDDLALISAKHGLLLIPGHRGNMSPIESDPTFEGYFATRDSSGSWSVDVNHYYTQSQNAGMELVSLDPAKATAHQRIALERSLAEVRERADG